ncbi:Rieske 2Fe-2S domain-containing protein [Neobacillus niacini]|uniref:Rieske 2Fe-2S domain-containing protein n=1 Tax=Neobacillus niacini TaxID=86668 RepID=UPI003982E2E8
MLKHEDNELLTRTGPGTPMGDLFRSYWIPALHADELPHEDCPPVKVKLLGEYLVALRMTSGNIVLAEEYCPHRAASLYFGRNEEDGIRCAFHGWKFDKDGNCTDIPSEPPGSKLMKAACIKTYPCKEWGGIIWTYMGDKSKMPELPEFIFGLVPDGHRIVTKWHQKCNYVQGIEANMDSSHLSFLHQGGAGRLLSNDSEVKNTIKHQKAPEIKAIPTDYGLAIGAGRNAGEGKVYWRASQFVTPNWTFIPRNDDATTQCQAWVPIDDENCMSFAISWRTDRPINAFERTAIRSGGLIHAQVKQGSFIPVQNMENDYLINRELQASGANFTGITGVAAQDSAVLESTRGIPDRTREILGTSDIAIIQMRRLLMNSARKLRNGEPIIRHNDGERFRYLNATSGVLPADQDFYEGLIDQIWEKTEVKA